MQRETVIVGIADADAAVRCVFEGTPAADGVVFKDREEARRDGDVVYAIVEPDGTNAPDAEAFDSLHTAAICLYYRFLPAGPNRATRRPWLTTGRRRAVVSTTVLSEPDEPVTRPLTTFPLRSSKLYPVAADTPDELIRELDLLRNSEPEAAHARFAQRPSAKFAAALIARTPDDLIREIDQMKRGILPAVQSQKEWRTPAGSCFTAAPLGGEGVCFVYPGVASPYIGLGADLLAVAPPLLDRYERIARGRGAYYLHIDDIYPRGPHDELAFYSDVVRLGRCAMSISLILTMLMRDIFRLQPKTALGYSFGEPIMLFALGAWRDPISIAEHMETSQVFRTQIHGAKNAVRKHWGLPEGTPINWQSYTVRATPAEAFAAIKTEPRVYVVIINTPNEVVIAGEDEGCLRTIERLGATLLPMPVDVAIHCEAVRSEYDGFMHMHDHETAEVTGIDFFSTSSYRPLELERKVMANAIAEAYSKIVDFPRLIRCAYAAGARVFVEMGGRRNCCTWIEKILKDRPHVAIPCDAKGSGNDVAILRALSRLVAHRVPLDLRPLYYNLDGGGSDGLET
jgi:PfaB family protein